MSKVIYEVREKVGYITLNRPEKKNAIDLEFASALFDAFDDAKKNPDVWVVLLAANGKDLHRVRLELGRSHGGAAWPVD